MNQVESALKHILDETSIHYVESSLRTEFEVLQKAHDVIHEFVYLAPLCFPIDSKHEVSWENRSAFLLYHWEVFNHAHRSSLEALCAYYNVACILLRTTLELLLKGAFWECLSHRQFRDSSPILDSSSQGRQIKRRLQDVFDASPEIESKLEQVSAAIFDELGDIIEERSFRLPDRTIVQQLDQWGIFIPITSAASVIYDKLYSGLSADIHVVPDRTDIGKRIVSNRTGLFEQGILPASLRDHAVTLHEIMDVVMVIELNILQDNIQLFESVRLKLSERLGVMEQLGLKYSPMRVCELLK